MRKSIRISALALMSAAMIGASATTASAYGSGDDPQVNICGNTAQTAVDSVSNQTNHGHHPTFCQTGFGNTITNVNPDINVDIDIPET
jgi:hypothetical protein